MSIENEVQGMTEAQAVRHLALAMDETRDELRKIRSLLTTIGLLLFTATLSLVGVFLSIIFS